MYRLFLPVVYLTSTVYSNYIHTHIVPPTISQANDERRLTTIDRAVRLPCDAVGRPTPSIVWMKDNQVLDEKDGYNVLDNGMLYIANPQTDHSGRYLCLARNSAGTAVLRLTLEVQG